MAEALDRIAKSTWFNTFILIVIVVSAALVGLETFPEARRSLGSFFEISDNIVLGIFIIELAIRIGAHGRKPWLYFTDAWNIFDFIVVVVCLMPIRREYGIVVRLARVIRAMKLVRRLPKLQLLVGALLKSLPSFFYVATLLGLVFYIYAVIGVFAFGENDPVRFGTLPKSFLTLFEVATLETWVDIMQTQFYGSDDPVYGYPEAERHLIIEPSRQYFVAPFYFVSFILLGTYIILNLCIGVILNSMQDAHAEDELERQLEKRKRLGNQISVSDEISEVLTEFDRLKQRLEVLQKRSEGLPPEPAPPEPTLM